MTDEINKPTDFIREAVAEDLSTGRFNYVRTRLPPEPNGYLHIGHAKAFLIDYLVAHEQGGELYLRFDDTNPVKEDVEYVDAIKEDARWLGIEWVKETYASDYFDELYEWAKKLVLMGKAYVDDQSPEEVSANRGTLTEPGVESPFRERDVEENMDLLERMKDGEFPDGSRVLRAKIDMTHPNLNMRDPVMYRIIHEPSHHRTGSKWKIYPMYDWAHGQNDSMEGITHSLCSLEYENHRPLYEWFLEQLGVFKPRQIEFSRLVLNYTILSKRYLRQLVDEGLVSGWDDPRMPTLRALRRRGYTPEAIHDFLHPRQIETTVAPVEGEEIWSKEKKGFSTLISVGIHVLIIVLVLIPWATAKKIPPANETAVMIYTPQPLILNLPQKDDQSGGGGGGGKRQEKPPSLGRPPRPADKQFVPPSPEPLKNPDPTLIVEPTVVAPQLAQLPQVNLLDLGDPLGVPGPPSSGPGVGGGIGTGQGRGVGEGKGPGVGPGEGGGFGGGVFRVGGGVTPPTVIERIEPQYSEEARKARYQGTVVLEV